MLPLHRGSDSSARPDFAIGGGNADEHMPSSLQREPAVTLSVPADYAADDVSADPVPPVYEGITTSNVKKATDETVTPPSIDTPQLVNTSRRVDDVITDVVRASAQRVGDVREGAQGAQRPTSPTKKSAAATPPPADPAATTPTTARAVEAPEPTGALRPTRSGRERVAPAKLRGFIHNVK